jgi:hypothetical protein
MKRKMEFHTEWAMPDPDDRDSSVEAPEKEKKPQNQVETLAADSSQPCETCLAAKA